MSRERIIPGDDQLQSMVERGMTHQQIADAVSKETGIKVGRSTISAALSRAGLTQRIRYDEYIPWKPVKVEHNHHYAIEMLRLVARQAQGEELDDARQARLDSWLQRLQEENAVVMYVYDSPDGFYYVPRQAADGDSLIRFP